MIRDGVQPSMHLKQSANVTISVATDEKLTQKAPSKPYISRGFRIGAYQNVVSCVPKCRKLIFIQFLENLYNYSEIVALYLISSDISSFLVMV